MEMIKNYYGSLCTEMYEILHKEAPQRVSPLGKQA